MLNIKGKFLAGLYALMMACGQVQADETWTVANQGLTNTDVRTLAVAADGTLFAGTLGGGVFKSVDKGATWTASSQGLTNTSIWSLAMATDGTLYAATVGAIFASVDKGKTWAAVGGKGLIDPRGFWSVLVTADGTLYTATYNRAIFKSVDKGANWTEAHQGLTNWQVTNFAVAPDGTLYVGAGVYQGSIGNLFKSVDQGETWVAAYQGLPNSSINSLVVAADGTVYAATNDSGVFKSVDKGATWSATVLKYGPFYSLEVGLDGTLFAGSTGNAYKSVDKGATWTASGQGLMNTFVWSLAMATDGTLYAGTYNGVWALTYDISTQITATQADCFFNWAERIYPQYFSPALVPTQSAGVYTYRHYTGSNSYLGIANDTQHLVYVGENQVLSDLGVGATWFQKAGCQTQSNVTQQASQSAQERITQNTPLLNKYQQQGVKLQCGDSLLDFTNAYYISNRLITYQLDANGYITLNYPMLNNLVVQKTDNGSWVTENNATLSHNGGKGSSTCTEI